jgi:type IV pilus assembly protein PilB
MVRVSTRIRRLLVEGGLVSAEDWETASKGGGSVLETLIGRGSIKEARYLEALGSATGIPPVDLTRAKPDAKAVEPFEPAYLKEKCILPLSRAGELLTVALCDPFDVPLLDDLNILAGGRVRPVISHPAAIKAAIERHLEGGKKDVDALMEKIQGEIDVQAGEQAEEEHVNLNNEGDGADAPAVQLVNKMLLMALREKASDIHVEPGEQSIRVRMRVDGGLMEAMRPHKGLLPSLISRFKIMASLDIAERFAPQDGKFQVRFEGRAIDFRLSILPVVGGEKAVLRILDQGGIALKLETLGYEERCLAELRKGIEAAYGMVLLTGPTGSGKSTTLYACVREVATPDVNVVTVEDPVEFRIDGINQVPVNPKRGLTFAGALRSILRQDPDIILVGEIRDKETAEIAVKAALTGHLVLSTLHTNDSAQTITRLVDMGIDPFMVSSSVLCCAAQRLVRKLCEHCRQPLEVPRKELLSVGFQEAELEGLKLYSPNLAGCLRCKGGYRGRFALLETLYLGESLKQMVVQGRSVGEIKAEGLRLGMMTLRRVGLLNAARGKTSLEEVLRTTMPDE